MKILFLTQYFPPETGAPQNRLFDIALKFKQLGAQVYVLTAMPNYPEMSVHSAYQGKFFCREQFEGIDVMRTWIYAKKTRSVFGRLLNYFSFVFTSLIIGLIKLPQTDFIFCESPPLFLGITALGLETLWCSDPSRAPRGKVAEASGIAAQCAQARSWREIVPEVEKSSDTGLASRPAQ